MQIEKLNYYKTSDADNGKCYRDPTNHEIIDKINEIIDYINLTEEICTKVLSNEEN